MMNYVIVVTVVFIFCPPALPSDVTFCSRSKCSGKICDVGIGSIRNGFLFLLFDLLVFVADLTVIAGLQRSRFDAVSLRADDELFVSLQRRRGRAD